MTIRQILVPWAALLAVAAIVTPTECKARPRSDWSAIERIEPGRRVRIRVVERSRHSRFAWGQQGYRHLKGYFTSVTDDSVSIIRPNGGTISFSRQEVLAVSVWRPFFKRPSGWVVAWAGALGAFVLLTSADVSPPVRGAGSGLFGLLSYSGAAAFVSYRMVYYRARTKKVP